MIKFIIMDIYNYGYDNRCYSNISSIITEYINPKHSNKSITKDTQIDKMIEKIKDILINSSFEDVMQEIKNNQDIIIEKEVITISITSTENQKKNNNKNISTIDLGECENKLKIKYNISYNESLLIYKIDILKVGMKIPRIEYEVFYSLYENKLIKLNLSICEDTKIYIYIPIMINEEDKDKYNISSNYFKDICYKSKSENGTDILINDRKEEYINKDMNACEENCEFTKYDIYIKKAVCSCNTKTIFRLFSEVSKNKTLLLKGFKDIKNIMNLNIMKCYYILFSIDGILYNIGFYIISSIILLYFICIILFYKIDYPKLKKQISDIINAIRNLNKNNFINNFENNGKIESLNLFENNKKIKKKKKKKKKKTKTKKKKHLTLVKKPNNLNNIINLNYTMNIIPTSNKVKNENSKDKIHLSKNNVEILKYNIYELNNLSYKEALKKDKRSYFNYYLSLLKTKHLLIFSFSSLNDYNSRIIKILLFFISFLIFFSINALFFNDSTLHKIYIDGGSFNLLYQISQIIYSSIISYILNIILKTLALTEKNILELKKNKRSEANNKYKNLIKFLDHKFILFFIISFIFQLFFWYYISLFCAVYENTQIHLIKDTLISFGLGMVYPLGIYLIPGIFRILSLKTNKREAMYKFSKFIQIF